MEIVKIKCPWCSAILSVKYLVGIEHRDVTCPVCKRTSPFANYKPYVAPQDEHTCYPSINAVEQYSTEKSFVGELFVPTLGKTYELKIGDNIIGRKASISETTIGLDIPNNKRISREHIVITVSLVNGRGLVHTLSLYKERLNSTSVNGMPLLFGDKVVLKHGDIINLPDLDMIFQIPDPDMTEIEL